MERLQARRLYRVRAIAALLALPGVLLIIAVLSGCTSEESTENTGTSAAELAERLFVLDSGKLYEIVGDQRVLFAEGPDSASLYDAAVSPDGTDVALSVYDRAEETDTGYDFGIDLHVSKDGEDPFIVAAHEKVGEAISKPNWLPDGEELIFMVVGRGESGGIEFHIDHVDLGTGGRRHLVNDALEPALSNDGSVLAYVSYDAGIGGETVMLADLSTGTKRRLLPEDAFLTNVANIAWAPADERLVFAASDPLSAAGAGSHQGATALHPTLRDIWMINVDGSGLRRVTEMADSSLSLAWSADARHVYALGDTGFWRVDTETGGLKSLGPPVLYGVVQTVLE